MNIEDLATYFASAEISFENALQEVISPTSRSTNLESSPDCASIIVPLTGRACFTINDQLFELKTGTVLHVGPSIAFSKSLFCEMKCSYILIQYRIINRNKEEFPLYTSHFAMEVENPQKITQCAMELADNFKSTDVYIQLKCKSLLLSFIVELIHTLKIDSQKQPAIDLEMIKSYIHQHYAESISISDIANYFGIKRRYLTSVFQRYIGTSPIEYLTAYRIRKAQELLCLTEKQILEISNSVGYIDNLYFSRVFKKKTGMSPTEYRKHQSHISLGNLNPD